MVDVQEVKLDRSRTKKVKAGCELQDEIIGSSPAIRQALEAAETAAPSRSAVLISGATGVGKELFAQHIHRLSGREGPFCAINCATLGGELLRAELFGFVKGAFTGADRDRPGLFRQARGGTLFLDEIGELGLEVQAALLRVLQEKVVRPIGGSEEIPVDVRVVAATHRDLEKAIEDGHFRADLYYRLAWHRVDVPSLVSRRSDIPAIARHVLARLPARRALRWVLTHESARVLSNYSWPGNVRELTAVLERLVRQSKGRYLRAHLVERILKAGRG